jgi:hypothetical protein
VICGHYRDMSAPEILIEGLFIGSLSSFATPLVCVADEPARNAAAQLIRVVMEAAARFSGRIPEIGVGGSVTTDA